MSDEQAWTCWHNTRPARLATHRRGDRSDRGLVCSVIHEFPKPFYLGDATMSNVEKNVAELLDRLTGQPLGDNAGVEPLQVGPCRIGFADQVDSPGPVQSEGCRLTREAWVMIARFWVDVYCGYRPRVFFQGSDCERRCRGFYARRRLADIARVAGEEIVKSAVGEVWAKMYGHLFEPVSADSGGGDNPAGA